MDVDAARTSYIGDWSNGVYHGQGIVEREDGFQHNGTFVLGQMNGHGKRKYPIEVNENDPYRVQNWYEGHFVNGQRQGKGVYHENMGNQKWWEWDGEFVNDAMLGLGTMTRSNGKWCTVFGR